MDALQLYHTLPPPIRSLAASVRGYQLRRWRYGSETERWTRDALDRENWSGDKWSEWQKERLAALLHRAAHRVPYYRQLWEERRRKGDSASCERIENWPILEKEHLRANPKAFIADDCKPENMFHEHTSG